MDVAYGIAVFLLTASLYVNPAYGQCITDTIDYMAANIQMTYEVVQNYPGNPLIHIDWTNSGPAAISNGPWSVYFSSISAVSGVRPNGTDLGTTGLRAYHANGITYKIEPIAAFQPIGPGQTLQIELRLSSAQAARTDIMPNWYVAAQDRTCLGGKAIDSTTGESLDFVKPFVRPNQWKRNAQDTYDPYTPQFRYNLDNVEDLGSAHHKIVPSPLSEMWDDSTTVTIKNNGWVVIEPAAQLMSEARYLAAALNLPLVPAAGAQPTRRILLDIGETQLDSHEAYLLLIDALFEVINIHGASSSGVFYGAQSLISAAYPDGRVSQGIVRDAPRFEYRGQHVDVSRNFHSIDDLKRVIDVMAQYKMNKIHLHLGDDEGWRLEIPEIPELTEVGSSRCHDLIGNECIIPQLGSLPTLPNKGSGYYTVAEYQSLLRYATERHIQVIPEFDMPGHAHAPINAMLARYRKYRDVDMERATEFLLNDMEDSSDYISVQYFTDNAINPCIESTYHFIEVVVNSVKNIYAGTGQPLEIFHMGGDEVPRNAWTRSPACDLTGMDVEELKEYFIRRVDKIIYDAGLDTAVWEDGLYSRGRPMDREQMAGERIYATVWDNVWEWGTGERAYVLANNNYKVIIAHATHLYFDMPQEPDPEERGLYWATRQTPMQKVFGFIPDDIYENMGVDYLGRPLDKDYICRTFGCEPLLFDRRSNIVGLQGQIWSEMVRTSDQLDYMIFPRVLALAERAWHKARWEDLTDVDQRNAARDIDWKNFANTLGYKELRRLDEMGVAYRLPFAGATVSEGSVMTVTSGLPGLPVFYSLDGETWTRVNGSVQLPAGVTAHLIVRSSDGLRSSPAVQVTTSP